MSIQEAILEARDHVSIEVMAKQLVTESVYGTAGGVLEVFSRLMPKAQGALQDLLMPISHFLSTKDDTAQFSSQSKRLLGQLKQVPYVSYRDVLVMVPEGFSGDLLDYANWLLKIQGSVIAGAKALVEEYIVELSMFLSNEDIRKALKSHEHFYKTTQKARLQTAGELSKFFKPNRVTSRTKFGDVVGRWADLEALIVVNGKLKASAELRTQLNGLQSAVQQAVDLLGLLNERLDKHELSNVSGDMAKHIAEGAYECGKYVELVSTLVFQSETLSSCVVRLEAQFEELVK